MEIAIVGIIIIIVLQANNIISLEKLANDNKQYFSFIKEKDYDFLIKAKYGESQNAELFYNKRIKSTFLVFVILFFLIISSFSYMNLVIILIATGFVYKSQYFRLKRFYKQHITQINMQLPYYLKNIEILIQHYTVPVALSKSIKEAPEIFKDGLRKLIDKINKGDSTIEPYMEFSREYPVRDSMRMMRLLYRLSLGSQENKHEQLIVFSRTISSLQGKAREQKYRKRLEVMESKTMYMLVVTGLGTMLLMILSLVLTFQSY